MGSFFVPLWFPDPPFPSIMVTDAAGYVKAEAGWATVLWEYYKARACWEKLLQACVSVFVMCVHMCPLGQCQEPRANRGASK